MCCGDCSDGDFLGKFTRDLEAPKRIKTEEDKAKSRECVKRLRNYRRDNGLCMRCGEPADSGLRTCNVCRDAGREASRQRRAEHVANRLCVNCTKPNDTPNFQLCSACREKQKRNHETRKIEGKIKKHLPEKAAEYRETRKKLESSRMEAGLCADCGQPAPFCMRYCVACDQRVKGYAESKIIAGLCVTCGEPNPDDTKTCKQCLRRISSRVKEINQTIKDEVFEYYGGYKCSCCGETEKAFLQLDHVNNDGAEHRRKVGDGIAVYRDLKARGFPPGYRILCANCNWGRHRNGGVCPHENTRDTTGGN